MVEFCEIKDLLVEERSKAPQKEPNISASESDKVCMPKAYGFMIKKLRTSFKDFISRQQSTIATGRLPWGGLVSATKRKMEVAYRSEMPLEEHGFLTIVESIGLQHGKQVVHFVNVEQVLTN
ncbi:hypothetical protein P5673_023975 [Acropora cervicornis]|uniref:Uncharacterized protein n=1 Tax=Acropora cervicornis TaxID=6130 RepID=A0AAD9UYC6_ACRCE|nr:hypothetical protein P5673_023975 [Acropora cervicornis]